MTKFCTGCHQEKPLASFNKNSEKRDGLQVRCKECNKQYLREHYSTNKAYYADKQKLFKSRLFAKIVKIKESSPCKDCGKYYPYYVMEFDHIDDNKEANVSTLISFCNWKKIEAEIMKCELVCANCHKVRTHLRRPTHILDIIGA